MRDTFVNGFGGVLRSVFSVFAAIRSVSSGLLSSATFFGSLDMSNPEWPAYRIAPAAHLHAVGVIAAKYNELEYALLTLMLPYTGMPLGALKYTFANTSNKFRTDLLLLCIQHSAVTSAASEATRHFVKGYQICAENRNLLMHSLVGDATTDNHAFFVKSPKDKPMKMGMYHISVEALQNTADDINRFSAFGIGIHFFIQESKSRHPKISALATLPEKPALPVKLSNSRLQTP